MENIEFVLNNSASGSIASQMLATGFDTNVLRPFVGKDGKSYINYNTGEKDDNGNPVVNALVTNSGATLRKDEWEVIDDVVVKAARKRLKIVNWLRGSGLSVNLPNGFGKTVYQYERQSDISAARITMDGLAPGDNDRPTYDLVNLPLPIIHKEVTMSARQLATSRNGNTPLDTSMLELAAIKVAEEAEKLHLGTYGTFAFGGATLYGLINFPNRITGSVTDPAGAGWVPNDTLNNVIAMITAAYDKLHYGPFKLWYSTGFMPYMMRPFTTAYDSVSLENRIAQIPQISSVEVCDYLTGKQLLLVQEDSSTVRTIIGMDIQTVQWQERGGLLEKFRVMAMMVPQMKVDINSNCGIVHYS
jgi:uncharacterized linocin/CFP29 family protein